eukprot:TRINITY_DN350_c0_g1_i1.p1 TRINITY_DN350_c0_g1~~TRINITY_DN350_c0_g1_i1.p1  ORF type:complete len:105 (-),score=6.50 TRINITY_DN350_c0_g1_i1:76-390(-)
MVHHVETNDEYDKVKGGATGLVVVDFSAAWCGPCRAIAPTYEALSKEHTDVVFIHVDVDKLPDLPDGKDVRGVPTFKFFKNGEQVATFSGASKDKLVATIKQHK